MLQPCFYSYYSDIAEQVQFVICLDIACHVYIQEADKWLCSSTHSSSSGQRMYPRWFVHPLIVLSPYLVKTIGQHYITRQPLLGLTFFLPTIIATFYPTHKSMSDNLNIGLKWPENLTGQVMIDKNEEEFFGNYSRVYLGKYKNKLVR